MPHKVTGPVSRHIALTPVLALMAALLSGMTMAQSHQTQADADTPSFTVGDLVVENAWARESVTPTGAVYLTVRNGGDQSDRLIRIASEVADRAELHASIVEDGVMRMRQVDAIEVPARGEAVLAPGGLHVMLIGLKAPLAQGGSIVLTLTFESARELEVTAMIKDIAYGGSGHGHDH
jgi:copper(I)-binding protein